MIRGLLAMALVLASCASAPPPLGISPDLGGTWAYVGGEPADDALLSWKDWPDETLSIDASRGLWSVTPRPGARSVLPLRSRVIGIDGSVLTMVADDRPRPFQLYFRIVGDRLDLWWGDHPDWEKPYLVYQRQ